MVDWYVEALQRIAITFPKETEFATYLVDVGDEAAVERCVAAVLERFGRIDVLCNIAGISGGSQAIATEQNMED
jgi:NADP-dependent 3-hydroxy acid dehydrogenase YdfG